MSYKSGKHFDSYEIGFLSTAFGSPSGEICVATVCQRVRILRVIQKCMSAVFFFPFFFFVPGDWTKDKEALTQNFECAVQQATTQALTNLFSKAFGLVLPVHS